MKIFNKKRALLFILFLMGLLLGLYRIYPYFFSDIPLGYDPGLYRMFFLTYFNNLPNILIDTLQGWWNPPMLGLITNIFQMIGYNADILLTWGLGFFSVFNALLIYIVLRKHGQNYGYIGVILYCISMIQYQAFSQNYYKQIIGISFLLVGIYLLQKRKYWLSIPIIISLFSIHRPSAIFFVFTLILYYIFDYIQNKRINYKIIVPVLISGGLSILMYGPMIHELIFSVFKPGDPLVMITGTSGTFFSNYGFFIQNRLPMLIGFIGVFFAYKKNKWITAGFITGFAWVGAGLFFYNRIFVFWDIFIILSSALLIGYLYENKQNIRKRIFVFFVLGWGIFSFTYIKSNQQTLIGQIEFEIIKEIDSLIGDDSIMMVTSSNYMPWVAGYTMKPTIAPGFLDQNKRNLEQRRQWRAGDGKVKCEMIGDYKSLGKLIYIWVGSRQINENFLGGNCFEDMIIGKGYQLLKVNFDK